MFTLDLPFPPSLNNLFVNRTGGRHPSTRYKQWKMEAGWEVARRHPVPITGRVKLTYVLQDKGNVDLDNLAKATTDLLVTHRLIDGDGRKIVRAIALEWSSDVKGIRVTVSRHIDCGASASHAPPRRVEVDRDLGGDAILKNSGAKPESAPHHKHPPVSDTDAGPP